MTGDIPPEGPDREPAGRSLAPVPDPVLHPRVRTFVTEPAVQLDDDPLVAVADVVESRPVTTRGVLP